MGHFAFGVGPKRRTARRVPAANLVPGRNTKAREDAPDNAAGLERAALRPEE
jgi:hypothetical protein